VVNSTAYDGKESDMNVVATLIRHTRIHAGALALLCIAAASSCVLQPVNENAASGSEPVVLPIEPGNVQAPDDPNVIPIVTTTPPIYGFTLKDGFIHNSDGSFETAPTACDHTNKQVGGLLTTFCAPCHALGKASSGLPPFQDVLNVANMINPATETDMKDIPFIVPGYPEKSRVFQRLQDFSMPNITVLPAVRRKLTTSETSVIEFWISNCLGARRPSTPPANSP
jgi:hypothetical protein